MPQASSSRARDLGVLALVTIVPIWGYSWVVTKVGLRYCGPFAFVSLVTVLCIAVLVVVALATHRPLRPPPLGWTVAVGVLQTSLFNGLATLALSIGGAGKVSVLAYTMPFWLLLLAWPLLGERLRGLQWPAVALALAGLVLVVRPWQIGGALPGVLACAAGLCWAGSALAVKLLQRKTPVDPLCLTAWQMAFGVVPLLAIALLTHGPWPQWTAQFVGALAYGVLLANAVCWALWVYALRRLPAYAAGMGTLAVPVLGVASAWLQLGEVPTLVEGIGMALIIAALAVLAVIGLVASRRPSPASAPDPGPLRP